MWALGRGHLPARGGGRSAETCVKDCVGKGATYHDVEVAAHTRRRHEIAVPAAGDLYIRRSMKADGGGAAGGGGPQRRSNEIERGRQGVGKSRKR